MGQLGAGAFGQEEHFGHDKGVGSGEYIGQDRHKSIVGDGEQLGQVGKFTQRTGVGMGLLTRQPVLGSFKRYTFVYNAYKVNTKISGVSLLIPILSLVSKIFAYNLHVSM